MWIYFVTLSRQTIDVIQGTWPVSALLIAALVATFAVAVLRGPGWPPRRWAWQLAVMFNPIIILAIGTVWACEQCSPSSLGEGVRHFWAMRAVDVLLFAQLIVAVWCVWRAAGWRMCIAAAHAALLWPTLAASFIAGMSLSGDWL